MNRVMDCFDSPGDTWLHATQVISDSSNLIVSLCRLSNWIYSNILLSSHWLANHMSCRKGNMLGVKKKMEIFWSLLIMNFVHNSHLTNYTKQRLWLSCGMIWVRANDSYMRIWRARPCRNLSNSFVKIRPCTQSATVWCHGYVCEFVRVHGPSICVIGTKMIKKKKRIHLYCDSGWGEK